MHRLPGHWSPWPFTAVVKYPINSTRLPAKLAGSGDTQMPVPGLGSCPVATTG